MARRILTATVAALAAAALGLGAAPAGADPEEPLETTGGAATQATPLAAAAVDVYTTPGEHLVNGRRWNTVCTQYSSTVERCSTDIWATSTTWNGRTFTQTTGWTFNNLTYLASPRAQWLGNPLATPGEHLVSGRRWKTECDTGWTGRGGCRSMIWATVPEPHGATHRMVDKWMFNNIVNFSAVAGGAGPAPTGPVPPAAATLKVAAARHPGHPGPALYARVAPVVATGSVQGAPAGTVVTAQLRDATGTSWSTPHATTRSDGAFTVELEAAFTGWAEVHAQLTNGNSASLVTSIAQPTATVSGPAEIDPLATPRVTGSVVPAVGGIVVMPQVWANGTWTGLGSVRTAADGTFTVPYEHNVGRLGAVSLRVRAATPSGAEWISTKAVSIRRMNWPNTVVSPTTAAEVAHTWRSGCPVGVSGLSTIRINHLGLDGLVHRGEIVVRKDLAADVADVFERSLAAGFPLGQMRNPNAWRGDDVAMMAANNTSGFNCRHVVGNPSVQSPHSYGIAVDINPWQNPYRDPTGKWWPSIQHVSRTPVVAGQLTSSSAPVVAFGSQGWSWFSGWDWHHFEYRRTSTARTTQTSHPVASPATVGSLSETDLVRPDAWDTVTAEAPGGSGGTDDRAWTHAVDAGRKSSDLFALGCLEHPDVPEPVAAVEGLLEANGLPGVTLALEFSDQAEATEWFTAWQAASRGCDDVTIITDEVGRWAAQRELYDGTWSETASLEGNVVTMTMLHD